MDAQGRIVLISTAIAAAVAFLFYRVLRVRFPSPPLPSIKVVSPFGPREAFTEVGVFHPASFHAGIDLRAAVGTPILAVADGQVESITRGGAGLVLALRLANDPLLADLAGARARYVHLESTSVSVGQSVSAGAVLGTSGDADGTLAPHLHFEVKLAGATGATDPEEFL